jgi:palmitoyl-protein thioesterase
MALFQVVLCLCISVAVFVPVSHSLPFVLLHGINDACSSQKVKAFTDQLREVSGVEGYCIEVGNGFWDSWFMPMEQQVKIVCDQVKQMRVLRDGYNLVGQSQGNQIARGVIEMCDGGPPINNFISLGGPNAGVASVPLCGPSQICQLVDNLIKGDIYSDFIQAHLAPSGYLKIPDDISKYMKSCKYLPKLNNEHPDERNSTYKERFTSLENLVLIMFENDTVIIPKESSWFGYYPDGAFSPVLPPQQTKLYKEDWFGLRTLDEAGKVKFISVQGAHIEISKEDTEKYVAPYLNGYHAPVRKSNGRGAYNRKVSPNLHR